MANMNPSHGTAAWRSGAVICLTLVAVAISYGSLSHDAGLHLWQTVFLAALAYGGAAEILFVGTLGAGGSPVAAVLGGAMVNTRNLAYGMNVGTFVPGGWRSVLGAHLVNDETVAFGRVGRTRREKWVRFTGLGVIMGLCWVCGAAGGQLIAGVIDTDMFGFDAAFPVILVAMVLGDLRGRPMVVTASMAVALALLLTPVVPPGLAAICALVALVPWFIATRTGRR